MAFSVATLATATLLLESTLLRFLAVAQFYHFAFLVVSLALLGFGASGSLLSLYPRLLRLSSERFLAFCGMGFTISTLLAYGLVNFLPFDSYSIAWDRRQILFFSLYYLSLTVPFIFAGLGIGAILTNEKKYSHLVYAANLLGSAIGVLLAPLAFWLAGVPGAILASSIIGVLPICNLKNFLLRWIVIIWIVGCLAAFGLLSKFNLSGQALIGMDISPYKGLSYANLYPGSTTQFSQWNPFSYVELKSNAGTRALPGLSYMYPGIPPEQNGLSIDADTLMPITLVSTDQFEASGYLPEAVAFHLHPEADALVLDAGAGLGVLQALAGGAGNVTVTIDNPLIPKAIHRVNPEFDIYSDPRVNLISETSRVFLTHDRQSYDVIFLPLTDAYRPISSGTYSLSEDYTLTVEAIRAVLSHLASGGTFVATRWLQTPPSESLRLITILDTAYRDISNANHGYTQLSKALVAFRGIQTFTILLQPDGWNEPELSLVRSFIDEKHYDLVWAPDIHPEETNRFNILTQPVDYELIKALFSTLDLKDFYKHYAYSISPSTDDHPFFFHFFRWQQTADVLANLGSKWQPFGGSGYLVLFAMLMLVVLFSSVLIVIPILMSHPIAIPRMHGTTRVFTYFTLIGIAYLFLEIPLIQRSILFLGYPTYAFTAVVLSLLLFSSIGSMLARKLSSRQSGVMAILFILALLTPFLVRWLGRIAIGWPLSLRFLVVIFSLAPLAVFMGLPFPFGISWLNRNYPGLTPWAWAVNGCASVIASVLAAILALNYGFTTVLILGAAAYGGAAMIMVGRKDESG